MRRPCWHFLQAGHSLASMRHPSLGPTSPPLHSGPAVPGPEHLREVVDALEVLRLVGRLAGEEPDVDQQEHDAPQVLGAADVPVSEHGGGEQPELIQREVAARPRQLRAGEVATRRKLRLRVLERRQHEHVAALGVAAVALAEGAGVTSPFTPPTASRRPRGARPRATAAWWRGGGRHRSDASAAGIATPADGPSFGTAPAGTCRCTSVCVNASSGIPSEPARARSRLHAACADSFMTSPSCPVSVICPLPGIWIASMNMMSPPTGVHASAVDTPTSGARPATSLCTLGWPAYFSRFFTVTRTVSALRSTTSRAALRSAPWISRSSWRTPASRVYSAISRSSAASAMLARSAWRPVSLSWRGGRERFAIASFPPG